MINNRIKVSVVVPVFNVEPYLRQCLNSITNQTLKDIEIILLDDCSMDNSPIICKEFASQDARIVFIQNSINMGPGPTRNRGIDLSHGEYIGFVDPDDWIDTDFYEKLYFAANNYGSDIAKTIRINVSPDRKPQKQLGTNRLIKRDQKMGYPLTLGFRQEHTTAIYRRSIFDVHKTYYSDIKNAEDSVFLLQYTYFAKSIRLISDTYYYYRQHNASATARKNSNYFENVLDYYRIFMAFINSHEFETKHYNIIFSRVLASILNRYSELEMALVPADYKKQFLSTIFNIMLSYKHDPVYIFRLIDPMVSRKRRILNQIDRITGIFFK